MTLKLVSSSVLSSLDFRDIVDYRLLLGLDHSGRALLADLALTQERQQGLNELGEHRQKGEELAHLVSVCLAVSRPIKASR